MIKSVIGTKVHLQNVLDSRRSILKRFILFHVILQRDPHSQFWLLIVARSDESRKSEREPAVLACFKAKVITAGHMARALGEAVSLDFPDFLGGEPDVWLQQVAHFVNVSGYRVSFVFVGCQWLQLYFLQLGKSKAGAQFANTLKAATLRVIRSHEERAEHPGSITFTVVAAYRD